MAWFTIIASLAAICVSVAVFRGRKRVDHAPDNGTDGDSFLASLLNQSHAYPLSDEGPRKNG